MLLAIDTSTRSLSLALYNGRDIIAESTWQTEGRHTQELSAAIYQLLRQGSITLTNLTLLAVAQGPGSFNGLRAGFSAAKGLAFALNLPLISIPTLHIIAAAQPCFAGNLVVVAQAGRGRVVTDTYDYTDGKWQGRGEVRIVSWSTLMADIAHTAIPTLLSGEIDEEGLNAVELAISQGQLVQMIPSAWRLRRAGFLAALAWNSWQSGIVTDPTGGVPYYLHQPGVPHP